MPVRRRFQGKRIDWSEVIFDLERAGYTQRQIAAECGFRDADSTMAEAGGGKVWVNRLKNLPGTQPSFHEGALLLGLWADVMQKTPKEAPLQV